MVVEIWWFNGFQNGDHLPSWIFEIQIVSLSGWLWDPFCISVPNFVKIGQTFAEISWLCDFQDGFSEIPNFKCVPYMGPVCVTVPNFVKMVIRLQRCGDLTIFRMAVFCRLGFLKFKFLTIWVVKSHFALSCQISQRSNSPLLRCRDFCNFSMAGDCHLGFSKMWNFNSVHCTGPIYVTVPNFIKIGQTVGEIWQFNSF